MLCRAFKFFFFFYSFSTGLKLLFKLKVMGPGEVNLMVNHLKWQGSRDADCFSCTSIESVASVSVQGVTCCSSWNPLGLCVFDQYQTAGPLCRGFQSRFSVGKLAKFLSYLYFLWDIFFLLLLYNNKCVMNIAICHKSNKCDL